MSFVPAVPAGGDSKDGTGKLTRRRRHLPFFYKLSFANKILLSTLALLGVLGVTGTVVFQLVLRSRLYDEVAASTQLLAASTAQRAAGPLASQDATALRELVAQAVQLDETIAYALVLDRDGEVVAHSFAWDPPTVVLGGRAPPSPVGSDDYRKVQVAGVTYLDVAAPVMIGPRGAGSLQLGVSSARVDQFVSQLNVIFLAVLAGLTAIGLVAALCFFRYFTRPIVELTHLADDVSVGNLNADFDFGVPVRCWEIKGCGQRDCAAYENTAVQCWFVDDTPCEGYEPSFPQKLAGCRTCEVYRAHKGDEIVQLYDSFRHMTKVLKTSRDELERSDRFQGSLIRNSFDGIIATDDTGTVQIFNRVAQNLTDYDEDDVVGKLTWEQIFTSELRQDLRQPLFQDGSKVIFGFYRQEKVIERKDGSKVDVRASGITLRENDRHVGRVFFFQDLREIKELKEEIIRSERLAATGQTVASISHSVKNILEGLRGGAYVYQRGVRIKDSNTRGEGWAMVERNIDHISSLVADLLNFARDRKPDLEELDPNALVSDVLETLRPKAAALATSLETDLTSAASPWLIDSHAMHQCLMNLITNALDATAAVDEAWVRVSTLVTPDDELEIRIQDNGPGIAPNLSDELFSSMVTTKGSKGTGLGLLVVHKIVAEHGGSVEVDAALAPGATFRVLLPRGHRTEPVESRPAAALLTSL